MLISDQGPLYGLSVSRHLRLASDDDSPSWLIDATESIALISASMSILHPGLYAAGMQCMYALGTVEEDPLVRSTMETWPSIFNAIQIISNRETPRHRDPQTRCEWFDLLCTLGTYITADLFLEGLGLKLDYQPGTLVAISGRLIPHSVGKCPPDRVCYAFYMRNALHKRFGVENPGWMKLKYL